LEVSPSSGIRGPQASVFPVYSAACQFSNHAEMQVNIGKSSYDRLSCLFSRLLVLMNFTENVIQKKSSLFPFKNHIPEL